MAIGREQLTFDEAKRVQKVHHHGEDLVDDLVTDAVAKVAQIVFAGHMVMEAGELPVAPSLVLSCRSRQNWA